MKKIIITAWILLTSLLLRGDAKAQDIPVPEYIISNVIDELIMKDHYEYTINLLERSIALYKRNELDYLEKIDTYYLTVEEYKVMIKLMEDKNLLTEEQLENCHQDNRREKRQSFLKGIFTGSALTIALTLLLILV